MKERTSGQKAPSSAVQGSNLGATAGAKGVALAPPTYGAERQNAMVAQRPNQTGLPDNLKTGIEALSGIAMDHVRVHYNSAQPAQLSALAYAQGSDIHLAPGQERHLPHEAWHVVQQAQGRVLPTMQMKDGVAVNDDQGLEAEARAMSTQATAEASRAARKQTEPDPTLRTAPDGLGQLAFQAKVPAVASNLSRGLVAPVNSNSLLRSPIQRWMDPGVGAALAAATILALGIGVWLLSRSGTPAAEGTSTDTGGAGRKTQARSGKQNRAPKASTGTGSKDKGESAPSNEESAVRRRKQVPPLAKQPEKPKNEPEVTEQAKSIAEYLKYVSEYMTGEEQATCSEMIEEAQGLLANFAKSESKKEDLVRVGQLLAAVESELAAHANANFEKVGSAPQRDWTVDEFEAATGGRKAKFRSLVAQNLISGGEVIAQYYTSYEKPGGFATAITVRGAPNTEIHTHYSNTDELLAAHFKPLAERFVAGHALNSLTPGQHVEFVTQPMEGRYGGPAPWGDLIRERKP